MIHLDTSFLIRALNVESRENHQLRSWVEAGEALVMCSVAWTEFLCGPFDVRELELAVEVVGRRSSFTEDHALIAARLFNESGRQRRTLVDCMIAAAAIAENAPVATANVEDFRRFEASGLKLA